MKFQSIRSKWFTALTVGLIGVMVFVLACGSNDVSTPTTPSAAAPTAVPKEVVDTSNQPKHGGVLRYALNLNCKTLDPAYAQSTCYKDFSHANFNSVLDTDDQFRIQPELVRSWSIDGSGKTIIFNIVQGARFHDGSNVTAQAVKFHFDRMMDDAVGSPNRGDVKSIESTSLIDDYTMALHLAYPDRALLATLAGGYPGVVANPTGILEHNSYDDVLGNYGRAPTGSGPFKIKTYTPDVRIVLDRNDDYWVGSLPYLDGLEMIHVPDSTARLAMIRTGDADIIGGGAGLVNAREALNDQVKNNENIKLITLPRSRMNSIGISTDVAPYNNPDLRAALAYSIDRQTLADTYFVGGAVPAYSPIAVGWGHNPDIKVYDYDIEKGKAALAKSGYNVGTDLKFWSRGTTAALELTEIYQAMMKEIGLNVVIEQVPSADYWQSVIQRKSHMVARWRGARPDPGRFIHQVFHSEGQGNVMGYDSKDFGTEDVDGMIEEAGGIYDIVAAKKIYDKIQPIVTKDAAHILTVYTQEFIIANKSVQGYTFIPDLYHRFDNVWLK